MDKPALIVSLESLNSRYSELEEILLDKISTANNDQELLLLQLHQVQEELEYYFLENKKLKEFIQESNRFPVLSKNFIKKLFLLLRRSISHPKLISKGINKLFGIIQGKLVKFMP